MLWNNNIIKWNISSEKHTFEVFVTRCTKIFILTSRAVHRKFPLNIYNFANFTNSNKSFYTDIFQSSILWENVKEKTIDLFKPDYQNIPLISRDID